MKRPLWVLALLLFSPPREEGWRAAPGWSAVRSPVQSQTTIAGLVIKAGTTIQQPLRNARIELRRGTEAALVERTDLNGKFAFADLPQGNYRLAITCDGFIRKETAAINVARGGPPVSVRFELESAPTATGWVLDSYGEPISGLVVDALRRAYDIRGNPRLVRAASAVTDDRGEYRIFWLDPGDHYFYVSTPVPEPSDALPVNVVAPTYAPGVTKPEDARPLLLNIGQEARVDFKLRRDGALWSIKGQTMGGASGRSVGASITLTPPAADPNLTRYRAASPADGAYAGEFEMTGIVPGSYILAAKSGSGGQEISAYREIQLVPAFGSPPPFNVTLVLSPPIDLTGRAVIEGNAGSDLRQASVTLTSTDPDLPSPRSVLLQADGQVTVKGMVPGSYVLDVANLPGDLYLKAARFGDADILTEPLALEAKTAASPLQMLIGLDGGHVQVKANPGTQVVLVPDAARRARRDQYRVATPDDDGQATFRGIPPGRYKLFAWKDLEPNAYLNADYFQNYEDRGLPVTIVSGGNPPISARVLP